MSPRASSSGQSFDKLASTQMPSTSLQKYREIGYSTYTEYLKSSHWRTIKRLYRAEREWACACCDSTDGNLQLHHLTYERLGNEALDDLLPVCQDCHSILHLGGDLDPRSEDRQKLISEYEQGRPDKSREKIINDIRREVAKRRQTIEAKMKIKSRKRERRAAERGSATERPLVQAK